MVIFFIVLFCFLASLISRWFDTIIVAIAGFELIRFLFHVAIKGLVSLLHMLVAPLIFGAAVLVVLLIINYLPVIFGKRSLLKRL